MIEPEIRRGIDQQNNAAWDSSLKEFQRALKKNPDNTVALYSISVSLFNLKDYGAALTSIDRAIELNKSFAPSFLLRSYLLTELGDLDRAESDANRALELDPSSVEANRQLEKIGLIRSSGPNAQAIQVCLLRGIEFQQMDRRDEAVIEFERVLTLDPTNFSALYSLGVLQNERGNPHGAIERLTQATKSDPARALGYFALATVYMQLKLYDKAIEAFDGAIEHNPESLDAYNNKAVLLHDMHRHLPALETLDKGLAHSPQDLKTLGNKAYLLTEFKQHTAASSIYKAILDIEPMREYVLGLYAYSMLHTCNWVDYEENCPVRVKNQGRR